MKTTHWLLLGWILYSGIIDGKSASAAGSECSAWLVESRPTDLPQVHMVSGVLSTGDVFQWLAGNATWKLDLLVQYWQLVAQPHHPASGDYGYSSNEMRRFGAHVGKAVYDSLDAAAERGVDMRIIQHSGVFPDYVQESANLAGSRPNVKNVTLLLNPWWGSGIVHTKVWISDRKDLYIGSANNDWKSLTQVKELGIYITNCHTLAELVEGYFENLWTLAHLDPSQHTKEVWDEHFQLSRTVPCWSHFLMPESRCKSPFPESVETKNVLGYPYIINSSTVSIEIGTPGWRTETQHQTMAARPSYLSFAPPELTFGRHQTDEQGWVDTILSAVVNGTVRISTMDWLGQSQYADATIYWSALSNAISKIVYAKHATVKLIVAYWTHTLAGTTDYLTALDHINTLCASSKYNRCTGKVEIKFFKVPGFERTGPKMVNGSTTENLYPSYTRVNHAKYAVSDVRAHIGTSNLVWDYFYTTSGLSFGTYNEALVSQVQAIFDADWDSPYAVPWQAVGSTNL
ncbi:hypothetical protein GOP47_0015471 [Adiantum capillus-veneris]|uniref:PLD phosphodiesterase domain-containing protein n=1 Tax=Adiantum capillus-veneris TaxID=13818 RepID=A0A9D4UJU8_ADICA|nr:hypothetical protein GOP47_0015471 [Adiantum capillus-veneris]